MDIGKRGRKGKAVGFLVSAIPVLIVAAIALIVAVALTPQGGTVSINASEAQYKTDGAFLRYSIPIEVSSDLPYGLDGLSGTVYLVDDGKGSSLRLAEFGPLSLDAGESKTVTVSSRVFLPTVYLIGLDIMESEGSEVTLRISAGCSYLLGLADFKLDATLSIQLAESGENISFSVLENTRERLSLSISGVNERYVPEDCTYILFSDMGSVTIGISVVDGCVTMLFGSDGDLDEALGDLSDSEDISILTEDGIRTDMSSQQAHVLVSALSLIRELI